MANKHRGELTIQLDRPRTLKFTFNALAQLEDVLGLDSIVDLERKKMSVKIARAMLWAGLLHEDPELTIEKAGELMDHAPSFADVIRAVAEAYNLALNGGDGEPGKEKAAAGTGAN